MEEMGEPNTFILFQKDFERMKGCRVGVGKETVGC